MNAYECDHSDEFYVRRFSGIRCRERLAAYGVLCSYALVADGNILISIRISHIKNRHLFVFYLYSLEVHYRQIPEWNH